LSLSTELKRLPQSNYHFPDGQLSKSSFTLIVTKHPHSSHLPLCLQSFGHLLQIDNLFSALFGSEVIFSLFIIAEAAFLDEEIKLFLIFNPSFIKLENERSF
jgi:hypothetical protein